MLAWVMNVGFAAGETSGPSGPPAHVVQFRDTRRRVVLIPILAPLIKLFEETIKWLTT